MKRATFGYLCVCLSLPVLAAACVTSQMQRLDSEIRAPRAPDSIVAFEEAPQQPYTVIARIESKTDAVFQSFDDLRASILDKAARLGGEAVIFETPSKETEFIMLTTGMIPSEKKKLAAEVIVFR